MKLKQHKVLKITLKWGQVRVFNFEKKWNFFYFPNDVIAAERFRIDLNYFLEKRFALIFLDRKFLRFYEKLMHETS